MKAKKYFAGGIFAGALIAILYGIAQAVLAGGILTQL